MLIFEPKSDPTLKVKIQNIKSHRYSREEKHKVPLFNLTNKQGKSHFFEFENYPHMNVFRELITKAIAKYEEETEQLIVADLELRVKLLLENRELQMLHKQFVESKVLTESEFWASRKKLLGKDSVRKRKQQDGLKSMMDSGIKPSDGKTNKVTFNVTPEMILQLWTSIQELLRHFWSSYPITTTYLHIKVGRLKDAMSITYSQLEAMKASMQSDLRHEISVLTLDAAFQHYEAELLRRTTQSCNGKRPLECV